MPESDLRPVPEDDDLNATEIEVMTDVEVLLDGSSVIDVFAVSSKRPKRVEVSERKLTELFRKVEKKIVDQERVWKSSGRVSGSRFDGGAP